MNAIEKIKSLAKAGMGYLNPSMYASMTKRVDIAVYETILGAYAGKFEGGFKGGGLSEGDDK